jgi:hypothetical protein
MSQTTQAGAAMANIQTNVRVAEGDKPVIIAIAARLRVDPGFRDKIAALLEEQLGPAHDERIKKLEQQVSWLLSGAIVVPRASPATRQTATAARPALTTIRAPDGSG